MYNRNEIPDILKKIVEVKRAEVERLKMEVPVSELETRIETQRLPLNMSGALWGPSARVIAEIKKASPTKGLLRPDFDPVSLATAYADNGAAAISVLTNVDHFQGSIAHLEAAGTVAGPRSIPVLRKEFVFDPYQVYESRAYGADAILLIVAMLTPNQIVELRLLAESFWMQCLVEIHDEDELATALDAGAEIVGINNRDLRTFKTDLAVSEKLAPLIPEEKIVVSESGIGTADDVKRVHAAGANAVLVGEALVTADDPGARLRSLQ